MPYFETSKHVRIYYEEHGNPDGPPVILLHGLGSNIRIWTPQIPSLCEDYRVLGFDYPAHGNSESRGPYSFKAFTCILEEFMDHLGLESAHLVALSVGCNIALWFASCHPGRVRSLVLEGPSGGSQPLWNPFGWIKIFLISLYLIFLAILVLILGKNRAIHLINQMGPQTHGYFKLLDEVEKEFNPVAYPLLAYENACPPHVGQLERVTAPAMIIRGREDGFPRRYCSYIQNHLKRDCPIFEIPHARHVVAVEKPELFNRAMLAFLRLCQAEWSASSGSASGQPAQDSQHA